MWATGEISRRPLFSNEMPSGEQVVDRRRQEESVLSIKPCLVIAVAPRPDVTRAKMLKPLYTGDPAPLLELRDVLLKIP
jgi:hypothetical protein